MAQVTARVSDQLEMALNHWAAEDGMQRADLIRQILAEATEARREGRATFERSDAPGPADLARLAAKLDAQTTELERVLRQNVKRDAELLKSAREDTLGVSDARARIVADVAAELRAALDTLHRGWMQTRDELLALIQAPPQRSGIDGKLDRILQAACAPRTTRTYNIGLGDWSGGMLVCAGLTFSRSVCSPFSRWPRCCPTDGWSCGRRTACWAAGIGRSAGWSITSTGQG